MTDKAKSNPNPEGNTLAYDIFETNYPYLNVKHNIMTDTLATIRRSIVSVNPFSTQQIPNQKRMGMGVRNGNGFYFPDPYPNSINYSVFFPTHYDPLKDTSFSPHGWQTRKDAPPFTQLAFKAGSLPRGCLRQIDYFRRCKIVNGADRCTEEADNILAICPKWALEGLKEKHRQLQQIEAIQTLTYREAMKESTYNAGRSVKDVSDKNWADGAAQNLRPDTMWADERYVNIDQKEINEAKVRHQERQARKIAQGKVNMEVLHPHHHDFGTSHIRTDPPMYP